jgi:hypothetical protein
MLEKLRKVKVKVIAGVSALGLASAVQADTILPADIATKMADGTTDIKTVIGLIFGVLVVILVYKMVKRVFA